MNSESTDQATEGVEASESTEAAPAVTFESLTFSDGTVINLDPNDIVVLVGPNNAGKSVALLELEEHIGPSVARTVIKAVSLRRSGTVDQLRELLDKHSRKTGAAENLHYTGFRYNISAQHLAQYWQQNLDIFRPLFCMRIATETRITDSNQQNAIPILDQSPTHPIHLLYADDRVEKRISSYFRRAFGEDLIVAHAGGSTWPRPRHSSRCWMRRPRTDG